MLSLERRLVRGEVSDEEAVACVILSSICGAEARGADN